MRKPIFKFLLSLVCACSVFACVASSGAPSRSEGNSAWTSSTIQAIAEENGETSEKIDYAGQAVLDLDAETQTIEVTVKTFIDGDTTHFHAEGFPDNVLKARYAAVNTPESTGKLEEWGKAAAKFTRSKLESATSIIIESDGSAWTPDSTGDRYLSWVWYKAPDSDVYRNLNLELLQEGLALGSKASDSRYGALATPAYAQAKELKLYIHSDEKDPDFFYGESIEMDLKELRLNIEDYKDKRVAFEGVVAYYANQGVYVEDFDEETQMYYGIYVYYGYFLTADATSILSTGNKVRITGVVQYYEAGDSYQVSDLKYNAFKPTDDDIRLIEKGHAAANVETTATTFKKTVTITTTTTDPDTEETTTTTKTYPYAQLALNTSISMRNLYVKSAYTTETGESAGAMTLTCEADGKTIKVRTLVLRDGANNLVTEDMLVGKTIDVVGIVDCFNGEYQIKVLSSEAIQEDGEPLFPPVEPTPPPTSADSSSESGGILDSLVGCFGVVGIPAALPLLVAVAVLMKKREN